MLRLIIVDDEKIIRETIRNLIDWTSLDINVVGTCQNGIEAFHTILDEYPDIVLTDIKMPGLSGLELIEKIAQTDHHIEFIILSGYGEFNYAKNAMKLGVKHFLLKPCNEAQIIEAVQFAAEDCIKKRALIDIEQKQKSLTHTVQRNIIRNIIVEGLLKESDLSSLIQQYSQYFNFHTINYEQCYFYFLEEAHLTECLQLLTEYHQHHAPGIPLYAIYVKNTLLFFFESYEKNYTEFDSFANSLAFHKQQVAIQYERISYASLNILLDTLLHRLKRYEMIYIMNGLHPIPTCNYNVVLQDVGRLSDQLFNIFATDKQQFLHTLNDFFSSINDADFLKALITNLLLKQQISSALSPTFVTEFLMSINESNDVKMIQKIVNDQFDHYLSTQIASQNNCKDFIEKTLTIVHENLSNPNLSLKWICESQLFMNVDYVSKQFIKQTGDKFSTYLTNARIKKAKEMIIVDGVDKIYCIAEAVGCGNNPQYFSQIFKKQTGMSPTAYYKKMNGE